MKSEMDSDVSGKLYNNLYELVPGAFPCIYTHSKTCILLYICVFTLQTALH